MYEASMHSQFDDDRYVLFLDESTVSLQEHERREMGERIDRITSAGGAVVLVSHDLTEIHELTQRVTVLRDGRVVGTAMTEELTEEKMLTLVVGSAFTTTRAESRRDSSHRGDPVLTVSGLTGTDLSDISFDCFSGEILGLTGLAGSGFEEVPYDLFGAHPVSGGTLTLDGKVIQLKGLRPNVAIADGICLVPGDRRSQGMALTESVRSNVTLPRLTSYRNRFGWLSKAGEEKDAVATTKRVGVWPADTSHLTAMLSGGNQQKALLAKWLNANPRVLILHEPTIGIDVPTRVKLQNLLREAADEGMCIICASGDFEQLEILCDRVIIFRDGKITAELAGSQLTKNNIALESLGATNE
jgi:ribose transport system ATP-binding protein